jgi:hypothetical protein
MFSTIRSNRSAAPKLIFFGIDGGTWRIIDRLLERGELPNLGALKCKGAWGVLQSLEPMISPVIWTSIASGKIPGKHGVKDFVVSAGSVRCKRFWDIAGGHGLSVGMLGYLVTWPPNRVHEFVIPGPFAQGPETHPPGLSFIREMDMSERTGGAKWLQYLAFAWKGLRHGIRWRTLLGASRFHLASKVFHPPYLSLFYEKRRVGLQIYADVFSYLCHRHHPDLVIFVTSLTDSTSHNYWKFLEAGRYGSELSPQEIDRYGERVYEAYREVDRVLGHLVTLCDEQTYLMVVSDHGFQSVLEDHSEPLDRVLQIRPEAIMRALDLPANVRAFGVRGRAYFRDRAEKREINQRVAHAIASLRVRETGRSLFRIRLTDSYVEVGLNSDIEDYASISVQVSDGSIWSGGRFVAGIGEVVSGVHHSDGIVLLAGPGVTPGRQMSSASILDVAPTILYALGLPIGKDMDGHLLTEAFDDVFLIERPVEYIDTWEPEGAIYEEDTEELTDVVADRLRSLGYL